MKSNLQIDTLDKAIDVFDDSQKILVFVALHESCDVEEDNLYCYHGTIGDLRRFYEAKFTGSYAMPKYNAKIRDIANSYEENELMILCEAD